MIKAGNNLPTKSPTIAAIPNTINKRNKVWDQECGLYINQQPKRNFNAALKYKIRQVLTLNRKSITCTANGLNHSIVSINGNSFA